MHQSLIVKSHVNRIELVTRTDCQETPEPQTDSTSTKDEDEDGDQTSSLDEETCVETTVKEDATVKPFESSGRVTQLKLY